MLSLQEISDRLEIRQLLIDYSTAIAQRRFDDLDGVFTADAYIDCRQLKPHVSPGGDNLVCHTSDVCNGNR